MSVVPKIFEFFVRSKTTNYFIYKRTGGKNQYSHPQYIINSFAYYFGSVYILPSHTSSIIIQSIHINVSSISDEMIIKTIKNSIIKVLQVKTRCTVAWLRIVVLHYWDLWNTLYDCVYCWYTGEIDQIQY